ncbi:MAG: hypothetical protein FWE45_03760 [Firmicutes bacterium]|nr:hypothetical protein [Bacillota bacterium]
MSSKKIFQLVVGVALLALATMFFVFSMEAFAAMVDIPSHYVDTPDSLIMLSIMYTFGFLATIIPSVILLVKANKKS